MATIAEQLTSLANTKTAIKDAIVAKGVTVADTDPFSAYPAKISQIQAGGGGAPATKFGVSIDNLIGNVDENGVYKKPTEPIVLDLTGVKELPSSAFIYKFVFADDVTINATDLTTIGSSAFEKACFAAKKITARFDSLEEIVSSGVFKGAFEGGAYADQVYDVVFGKLKKITGSNAFAYCFDKGTVDLDYTFPALEEIQADSCFYSLETGTYRLSKVKKIIGPSSKSSATIYPSKWGTLDFYLPSATELGGYVTNARSSYKCNLHFAAANQAAIEACSGYEYKFGATEIYFDL